eukprot:5322412-Pleurochrysis_carterae.AAC.1
MTSAWVPCSPSLLSQKTEFNYNRVQAALAGLCVVLFLARSWTRACRVRRFVRLPRGYGRACGGAEGEPGGRHAAARAVRPNHAGERLNEPRQRRTRRSCVPPTLISRCYPAHLATADSLHSRGTGSIECYPLRGTVRAG